MTEPLEKAVLRFRKAEATSDRAWDAYHKSRVRLAHKRGTFSAEQAFIDASQAVGRAHDNLFAAYGLVERAVLAAAPRGLSLPDKKAFLATTMAQSGVLIGLPG